MITPDQANHLLKLVQEFAEASVDYSWRGCQDPADVKEIVDHFKTTSDAMVAAVRSLVIDESNITHGDLYAVLRAMHWDQGKLAVIQAKDLTLGTMTYSGDMLDTMIVKSTTKGEG